MRAMIVVFHLPKGSSPAKHRDFRQAMYGEDVSVAKGRYRYRRHGLLDEILHVRMYWGAVIIKRQDFKRLKEVLERFSAEYGTREVKPTKKDLKALEVCI
jgi:hypothetical protein